MQKKFGIAVVVAIQEKAAAIAQPRPGVRGTSRRRLVARAPVAVAA